MRAKRTSGPLLWPLALVIAGVALLLHNFLLLGGFNLTALWPLLLVLAGAQILLRGDLLPGNDARTFGITRGSVESATLEISAGEIDVMLRPLQREGRLIAGTFAAESRPDLNVVENHATLRMDRTATPWLSFADWDVGLTPDLPWQVFVSTSFGHVRLDLSQLIIADTTIATGIGDIRLTLPAEAFGALNLRSALGDVHVVTPPGVRARITVQGARTFGVHVDEGRYKQIEPGVYLARDPHNETSAVEVVVYGTFGDAYLS